MKKKTDLKFKEVLKDDILPGMKVYLTNDGKSDEWTVLDVGVPFILIENLKTHFASLYRVIEKVFIEGKNNE